MLAETYYNVSFFLFFFSARLIYKFGRSTNILEITFNLPNFSLNIRNTGRVLLFSGSK